MDAEQQHPADGAARCRWCWAFEGSRGRAKASA